MILIHLYRVARTLFVLGIIAILAYEAYFKEPPPPPLAVPPPDPMANWQPPIADAAFSLNVRRNNTEAVGRMFVLFAFAKQKSVEFDILTEPSKPSEAIFYFTQHKVTGETHVTEVHVTNIRHIHRGYSPPMLAQSP